MNRLVLVRGAPGSGKSTIGAAIADEMQAEQFENDAFFTDENGVYRYVAEQHAEAKNHCLAQTIAALASGKSVVVANTFTTMTELQPYLDLEVSTMIVETYMQFPNAHDVPDAVVEVKRATFEPHPDAIQVHAPSDIPAAVAAAGGKVLSHQP